MTKVRDGLLLGKKMILKSDYLPACQNKSVNPRIETAPNYHQARSLHVHGVAMPTAVGIRNLLDHIGAHKASNQVQVLWISLREEPVIYINGKPFVLRDLDNPFTNMGMKRLNVDQMEEDLRGDASRHGNKILVTDELPDGEMVDQWEPVYQELQAEGYLVKYARVPVTEPKDTDFDALIRKISQADINTEIIFSCQMGRGNTTAGMVIATLLYFKRPGASDNSFGRIFTTGRNITYDLPNSEEDKIRRGEYAVIKSLIRVLEGGVKGKRQVDNAIDRCASIQNLREAIPTYSSSILHQPDEKKREAAVSLFVEYLERYYFLICFSVYLDSEGAFLQTGSLDHVSFADWMQARPELYGILRRFLRRDHMGALAAMKPSLTKVEESTDGRPHEMSEVAALRSGLVLGSQTVLKSDHSHGCRNASLRERVDGAPNFREVPGFAVYGVANPTVDGIRSVIERVWSLRGRRPVFWHNLREEPVIYINGIPFVIREVERPYKNMLGYKGTDRYTVEGVEALLKEDILREAIRYNGAIMVIHETEDQNVFDCWEHVDAYSVQTPLEVFKNLETEGFPVKYTRVPVTDGKAPRSSDFDTLTWNIASASKDTAFVFNCQIGKGRTTTGTVIACLVKLRMNYGRPIKVLTDSIVYDDSLSGEEEHGRAFGMDDILLLRKFTTLFDNGVESREALDAVIDRCSAVQNIREAVLHYRKVFNQQHVEPRLRNAALKRSAEYLERYFWLITFAAYIGSENLDVAFVKGGYKNWLHEKPEVQALKWSVRVRPGRFFTIPEELQSRQGDAVTESIINKRSGSVLCKGSILKKCQRTSSRLQIDEEGEGSTETIREEAHVYINGIPFVLRELHKPVDILTHVGIAGVVVETWLKEDILSEVRETGGRMLLHREEYSTASNQSQVIGYWEYIQPEDVKTSAEIYAAQERDALASNVDAIHGCKDELWGKCGYNQQSPDEMILMIVRFLPAKEGARVSVLSKRFQKLFTIIEDPELDENQENLRGFLDRVSALPELITRIRRFSLKYKERVNSADFALVNKCICHVLKLGVMDFQMCLDGVEKGYSLPPELFTSKTLAKLTLGKGFEIEALPRDAFLPALQTLVLDSVRFFSLRGCAFQGLLSASPELRELSLRRISIGRVFSAEFDGPHHQSISFDTPNLQYLEYSDLVAHDYPIMNLPALQEAKLTLQMLVNTQWDNVDLPHDVDIYWSNPKKLLKGIRNVKVLHLSSSSTFEGLNYFSKSIPILEDLHHLTITHEDIEYCWEFLPCLLERSPNLKTLIIRGGLHYGQDDVCRCLSSYSCLVTSALEVVEVSLHNSTSRAEWDQLEHFLGKLPCLQLLKVRCGGKISREEKLRMARELCQLPKASSKCKIVCT
ncbi:hypothetical protein IGI04_002677 [Brassica rapa subsp. trilocularis]|uniref:FBD domain-containing protein n=1 Tax=Brassica rapa subsp. trilocularis TaxID=1813537 RepID=A0ABQ7NW94_BRACM|nr:hypothetical protein IGI04_002677 [Brassica rapa subsp. trilocularis]